MIKNTVKRLSGNWMVLREGRNQMNHISKYEEQSTEEKTFCERLFECHGVKVNGKWEREDMIGFAECAMGKSSVV